MLNGHYYFGAVDQILTALHSDANESVAITRSLRVGCVALTALVGDMEPGGDLDWAIRHSRDLEDDLQREERLAVQGAGSLLQTFLLAEDRAFREAGVSQQVVNFIRGQAADAFRAIENQAPNWDTLRQAVDELRREVCSAAKDLGAQESRRHIAKQSAYVLGGAGTAMINASVDAVTTLGLLPWMTALSSKLGVGLISRGVFLQKPPSDRN